MALTSAFEAAIERITVDPILFGPLILCFAFFAWSQFTRRSLVPEDLPWLRKKGGFLFFGDIRLRFEGLVHVRDWLSDGYSNYSKQGKSYIYRTFVGTPEIIIPKEQVSWLLEYPDEAVSVHEMHREMMGADWTYGHPDIIRTNFHEHVIHRNLARKMTPAAIMEIWDEVVCSINDTWGYGTNEWKELCVYDNALELIPRISNRLFVGTSLCRNTEFLKGMCLYADDVFRSAALIGLIPAFLKPVLAPLICIPNKKHYAQSARYLVPFVEKRFADMDRKEKNPGWDWQEPNDYIQWHINQAKSEGRTQELEPDMVSRYTAMLNFAAIHTTVFSLTNIMLDLVGSDPAKGFWEGIREEVERVYAEEKGVWTKPALNRLIRTDSAIRESLRLRSFLTRGVKRKVLIPHGAYNKTEGWTAPQNAHIAVDAHSIHHDPEIYPNPEEFDAFRFSRPREEIEAKQGAIVDYEEVLRSKNLSMVTTGATFLPWGHGRHACPGRFFVSHELKMMFAYMVMNYDIEPLPQRPDNVWIGYNVLPPMKATIRVKRKTDTVRHY
ncbi:cytochrome P450 [Pseudovirgaria hyperparasitica]|uniref:Cytochrome P450 n=1 Tax=Pseudovirgaria hyperparasitica TaxID=470096 RepID=A0A6A6VZG8_9PEZI|nr:cytochrome P450 [Pseudovirgaria hyperparasitica]KAF2755100.1 cytochrome P450 [Pseudovirgaria hyperparasitica]